MTPARRLPGQRRARPHRVHHHSEFARQGDRGALEANLLLQFQPQLRSALSERTRVSITVAAS